MKRPSSLRLVAVVLGLVMAVTTVAVLPAQDADAETAFDRELIRLVNLFRSQNGLGPLTTSQSMSAVAQQWTEYMASGASSCLTVPSTYRHDVSWINNLHASDPPGTVASSKAENINFACGSPGREFGINWGYSGMPGFCASPMDYTSAAFTVCSWISSSSHRSAILSTSATHIGSGSVTVATNGGTNVFATHRFTRSAAEVVTPTPTPDPIPNAPSITSGTCLGQTVTVNIALGQTPTEGDDVIQGTNGADTIDGLGGDDVICGWAGDDTIYGGSGADLIDAGWGDDRVWGYAGNDDIRGSWGDDTLHGNNGNDTLDGSYGNDRIFGYANNDTITGGNGDDRLHGNFGNDRIFGEAGNDRIFGYGDDDTLSGGLGDDLIGGNFGNDQLNGNDGNDTMYGSDGSDTVSGDAGDDFVEGNSGTDTVNGGAGHDTIDGGINADTCNGNSGFDIATRCETVTSVP